MRFQTDQLPEIAPLLLQVSAQLLTPQTVPLTFQSSKKATDTASAAATGSETLHVVSFLTGWHAHSRFLNLFIQQNKYQVIITWCTRKYTLCLIWISVVFNLPPNFDLFIFLMCKDVIHVYNVHCLSFVVNVIHYPSKNKIKYYVSWTIWGNFFKPTTNCHLGIRMNWSVSGGGQVELMYVPFSSLLYLRTSCKEFYYIWHRHTVGLIHILIKIWVRTDDRLCWGIYIYSVVILVLFEYWVCILLQPLFFCSLISCCSSQMLQWKTLINPLCFFCLS